MFLRCRRPGKTSLEFLGNTFHCWSLTSQVKKSKKIHTATARPAEMIISGFSFTRKGPSFRKRCQLSFPCTCHLASHLKEEETAGGRSGGSPLAAVPGVVYSGPDADSGGKERLKISSGRLWSQSFLLRVQHTGCPDVANWCVVVQCRQLIGRATGFFGKFVREKKMPTSGRNDRFASFFKKFSI